MKNTILNEGLDYHDMVGQIEPLVTVDEYSAKTGKDCDIVTLSFSVNSEAAGDDIAEWFEKGYSWVLDASRSEGEVEVGKYLVFVEMNRRSTVPNRIVELLSDLKTLSDLDLPEWKISIDGKEYKPDVNSLRQAIICNPGEYREKFEDEESLNEMRVNAGLDTKSKYTKDSEIKDFISKAGL